MTSTENEDPDSLIEQLHRTREMLAEKFNGDLVALAADAQTRQLLSGRKIIRRSHAPVYLKNKASA